MTKDEARMILHEDAKFMRAEGEYYYTIEPPYSLEEVAEAKQLLYGSDN